MTAGEPARLLLALFSVSLITRVMANRATARSFRPSFSKQDVDRMMKLVETTELPDEAPYPEANLQWTEGVNLPWLKQVCAGDPRSYHRLTFGIGQRSMAA